MMVNPPFFVTLVAGLLIAFAFQLLLTNFGIAAGITALGYLPDTDSDGFEAQESKSNSFGSTVRAIGFALGFGTLLTVNTVLFVACWLAVKLSMASSAVMGAILGVVIWSAYFLVLVWLGSTAADSLFSSVLGVIDSGWQGLRAIAKTVFRNQSASADTSLREQIAAEIAVLGEAQRQLSSASADRIQATLQSYLETPTSTLQAAQSNALEESDNGSSERTIDFKTLFRTIQNWLDSGFDGEQIQSFNQHVEQAVRTVGGFLLPASTIKDDVADYLINVHPRQLTRKTIKLEFKDVIYDPEADPQLIQQQLTQLNRDSFVDMLNQRDDLSAAKTAKLADQLEAIRLEVLSCADSGCDRSTTETSDLKTQVKSEAQALWQKLVDYLSDRDEKLTARTIQRQIKTLLKEAPVDATTLQPYLPSFDHKTVLQVLEDREDLTEKRVQQVCDRVEQTWHSILETPQPETLQLEVASAKDFYNQLITDVTQYLQTIDASELNLESIQYNLTKLLNQPQISALGFGSLITLVNWEKLAKALKERGDLTEEQITQVIDQAQQVVYSFSKAPRRWAASVQSAIQNFPEGLEEPLHDIETIRLNLLNQIEQAQQAAQKRVEDLKQQAQKQVENARKATAIAAWWLFSIALTSMATSAIAGALAASN